MKMLLYMVVALSFFGLAGCGGAKVGKKQDTKRVGIEKTSQTQNEQAKIKESNPQQKIVSFGTDNARLFPSKLKFSNGTVIDVRDINPYKDLPYKKYRTDTDRFEHFYDLSEKSRAEQDKILEGCRINPDAYRKSNFLRIFVKTPVVEIKDSIVAIAYHKSYYSNEEDIICTQGTAIIYDHTGKEISRIEDKKDGFYDIRLSEDGKYLMQKYGIDYGEDGSGQLDRGFKFYDTKTGNIVFEWELGKDKFIGGYDMFFNTHYAKIFRVEHNNFEQYIIDYTNGEVYTKFMDRWKYLNDSEYSKSLFPNFLESKNITDLIKDGFKKIK